MSTKALKTVESLSSYLDSVINESLKSALQNKALQEKEKQLAAPKNGTGTPAPAAGGAQGPAPSGASNSDPAPSKTMDTDAEKLKQGSSINPDDITDKLNSIRSGKSFKDSAVKGAMSEYVGSLTDAEKTSLLAFLKGIAQIVTGEVPGQDATDPDSPPADVHMHKKQHDQHKQVKPNVIKNPGAKQNGSAKNVEDTSAPVSAKKRPV